MSVFHFRTSLGLSRKEFACYVGDMGSVPGLGRSPGKGNGHVVQRLPGKSHGQRSLAGCRPWGHKRVRHDSASDQQQQYFINIIPCGVACIFIDFKYASCLSLIIYYGLLFFIFIKIFFSQFLNFELIFQEIKSLNFFRKLFFFFFCQQDEVVESTCHGDRVPGMKS